MADAILDASAILAVIPEEPGAVRVERHLPGGTASSVNVGGLHDLRMPRETIDEIIAGLQLDVRAHDLGAALAAGHLRPETRAAGLSLGDRACLALATAPGLPVVTADRSWSQVAPAIGVRVETIR